MIPKIIHQIVFGQVPNMLIQTCLESWKILENHGYKIYTWDYDHALEFIQNEFEQMLPAFRNSRNLGESSDIFRYLIISYTGGYYIDWDIKLKDFQLFLNLVKKHINGILLIDPINNSISCEFLSAHIGESFLFQVIKEILEIYNKKERNTMDTPTYSGPYRLQQTLEKYGAGKQDIVLIKEAFELDYWEIRTVPEKTISTQPMIHYWLHTWMK